MPSQTHELPVPGVRSPVAINGHALYTQTRGSPLDYVSNDLFEVRPSTTTRSPPVQEVEEPAYLRVRTTRPTLPPIRQEVEPTYLRPRTTRPTQPPQIQEEPETRRGQLATKYRPTEEELLLQQEQAENAHYTFGTSIDDTINDHAIHRQETRSGLALKGMYSYSDGYFKRTIHYEADENGYRVVK